jgi:DNA-binding response OmpR family regulator
MNILKKILIIEDEKTLARALELKLIRAGFNVRVVSNGEEGLVLLMQEAFSLILLDLVMPKKDGFMVLAELKLHNIETPVIVLTNLSQESDMKRTREFGAKGFYIKSNTSILTIVDRVIEILK